MWKLLGWSIRWLLNIEPELEIVMAPNNYTGIPPNYMGWKEALVLEEKILKPYVKHIIPTHCPICDKELIKYKSDFAKFEKGRSEFLVTGAYCKDKHYTHIRTT